MTGRKNPSVPHFWGARDRYRLRENVLLLAEWMDDCSYSQYYTCSQITLSTLPQLTMSAHATEGWALLLSIAGFGLDVVERSVLEAETSSQEKTLPLPFQILSFL